MFMLRGVRFTFLGWSLSFFFDKIYEETVNDLSAHTDCCGSKCKLFHLDAWFFNLAQAFGSRRFGSSSVSTHHCS